MNLQAKAENRKQIEDMILMQRELKGDLQVVNQKLKQLEDFKNSVKKMSKTDEFVWKTHSDMWTQNKFQLETTIFLANEIISQLKLETTPRAGIQWTRKLV